MTTIGLIPSQTIAALEQDDAGNWLEVPEGQTVVPFVKIPKPETSAGIDYIVKHVWFEDRVERQWEQIAAPPSFEPVTMRSFSMACGRNLWNSILAVVESIPDADQKWEAQQYVEKSPTVARNHPLVLQLAAALKQTDEQVDAIFAAAKLRDTTP